MADFRCLSAPSSRFHAGPFPSVITALQKETDGIGSPLLLSAHSPAFPRVSYFNLTCPHQQSTIDSDPGFWGTLMYFPKDDPEKAWYLSLKQPTSSVRSYLGKPIMGKAPLIPPIVSYGPLLIHNVQLGQSRHQSLS